MNPLLSERQLCSLRESSGRVNLWSGAIRSGKTISSLMRWVIFCSMAPRRGELVIIGRTRDAVWRNVVGPLQDPELFGVVSAEIVGNHGAPTVTILGRRVYVLGASDAKAEKVLRGLTVAGAYVDEVTVIPQEFFVQLLGRMSVDGAQLFGTTNPDNPAHWLKTRYLDRLGELPDWRHWHFTLDDNPSLSEAYRAALKAEFTGLWYRRFILGEWVAAEGAVYSMWDPTHHVIPWDLLPPMRRLLSVGIDYGTTNASSAILLGLSDETDPKLYFVDEWRHDPVQSKTRLTDAQLSEGMRSWMAGKHLPTPTEPRVEWLVVDPAAASFKVQLYNDGLTNVSNADNDVAYGIRTTASLLGARQLVVSDRCKGWINEVGGYSWDDKATEKGEDKPVKVADHSLDAGRYAITTTEALWRPHLKTAA